MHPFVDRGLPENFVLQIMSLKNILYNTPNAWVCKNVANFSNYVWFPYGGTWDVSELDRATTYNGNALSYRPPSLAILCMVGKWIYQHLRGR